MSKFIVVHKNDHEDVLYESYSKTAAEIYAAKHETAPLGKPRELEVIELED